VPINAVSYFRIFFFRTCLGKAEVDSYVMDLLLHENLSFNLLDSQHFKHFVDGLTGQENTLLCRDTANKRLEVSFLFIVLAS
jgi:hypothetical protein